MRRDGVFYTLAVLLAVSSLSAQNFMKGKGKFLLDVDFGRFSGTESQVYTELYYGIRQISLSYKGDSNRYVGGAKMKVEVWKDTTLIARREWLVPHTVTDTAGLNTGQTMVGIESFGLPPGTYRIILFGYDVLDPARRDSIIVPCTAFYFPKGKMTLSDIELCTNVQSSSDTNSIFYKNTLEVVPNPSELYGSGLPFLYYYVEVYNPGTYPQSNTFIVRSTVRNSAGSEVLRSDRKKEQITKSSVEVGKLNITALKSGTYALHIDLLDSMQNLLASAVKRFFIFKPGAVRDTSTGQQLTELTASEYMIKTESELDQELMRIKYIESPAEQKQSESIRDISSKRKFLFEFWQRRDPDPQTIGNEFKVQYLNRIEYTNNNFTHSFREGWRTDRGRIYVVYGPPDEIERFTSSSESNPYETWNYHAIQGGVIFVFVDRLGMSDFMLVHSTHRDELHDDDWFRHYAQKMH